MLSETPEAPEREPSAEPDEGGRKRRPWRGRPTLLAEGLAVASGYLLSTLWFLRALRSSTNTFFGDVLIGFFGPEKHGTASLLRDGVLPTWVRDQFAGEPYIANLQHAVLYPGNLPFWFLPTSVGLELVVAAHVALAATGMWAYCRIGLRTSAWGALIAGLGFGFGGLTLQHIVLLNQLQVIAWTPLVLLGGHLALERGRLRHVVFCALAIGMQFLAGHPEEWVYTLVMLALQGIVWALVGGRQWLRRALAGAVRLGGAVLLFVLLFAWQLLPTLQLQRLGWRSAPGFDEQYPLPVNVTVNSLLPDYGRVLTGEFVGFVGIVALGLAALGIAAGRRDLRWVRVWTGALVLLGLLMAVGERSPLYALAYRSVDVIAEFRVPARWLLLATFGLAAAAAIGTDALLDAHVGKLGKRVKQGLGAALALGVLLATATSVGNAVISRESVRWWALAAAITVVVWLLAAIPKVPRVVLALVLVATCAVELKQSRPFAEYNELAPTLVYDDPGPVMARLGREGGRYLTIADTPRNAAELDSIPVPAGYTSRERAYYLTGYPRQLIGRPGWEYSTHAETVLGRDGGLMPIRAYSEFFEAAVGAQGVTRAGIWLDPPSKWNFQALDFLGIRWFIAGELPPAEGRVLERHGFRVTQREGYVQVWERPEPPLARMVYGIDLVPDAAERLRRLREGYPLMTRAMVEKPMIGDFQNPATPPVVQTTEVADTRVAMRVQTEREGLLVLADPWHPSWKVRVDGRPAKLYRTDHGFRGVRVAAGEHQVVFTYEDRAMQLGGALAALTVIGLALVWVRGRRRQARAAAAR